MIAHAGPWFAVSAARAEDPPPASAPSDDAAARATQPWDDEVGPRPDMFRLNVADLYVGFQTDYQFRRVRSSTQYRWRDSTHENSDLRLREVAGTTLAGHLYDPNLFEYRASLEFGLTQTRFVEKENRWRDADSDWGWLYEYDVAIDAFKAKPVSFNAYTRRYDDRVPRRFLPSLHEIQTEAGVAALILTGPVTTEVGYSYRDTERTGNRLDEDDESLTTNRFYIDSKWDISDTHHLHFSYDHEHEENNYQGSLYEFNTTRDEFRLDHDLAFGDGHRLDSYFRFDTEKGDLPRDELEIAPRLTLQHTDKLKSIWRYGYYRTEQDAIRLSQHQLDGQGLYTPNDNWRFSLSGFGLYERVDRDVETQQYGVSGEVTYLKKSSLGDFSADLNVGYDTAITTGDAGRRYVRGEAHTLGAVRPVFLRQRNVILSTVIAHDEKYRRIYVQGTDYIVTIVRGTASINRIPWGRIAEGDVVYFDYQYTVPAEAKVDSYRADFRVEHAFPFGLTPYYYLETRTQEVDRQSWGTPLARDNQDRHRLGVRYGRERWGVGTEYEIFDDSVEPYDAWHLTGSANLLRSRPHSLDMNGELSFYRFEGGYDKRRVWFFDVNVKDRVDVTDLLSLNTGAEFRRICDDVRGDTTGVDLACGFKYTKGYLTVELDLEYDLLSVVENREHGFGIFLNVKRDLSHLLPGAEEDW